MTPTNIDELLRNVAGKFDASSYAGSDATLGFHLVGEGSGDWSMTIRDGTCEITPGPAANPDAVLDASAEDFINMLTGSEEEIGWSFMQGRFNMTGNILPLWRALAMIRSLRTAG